MVQHTEDKFPTLVKHQEELTQEGDLHSLLTLDSGVHINVAYHHILYHTSSDANKAVTKLLQRSAALVLKDTAKTL